jgi:hypothetical protein
MTDANLLDELEAMMIFHPRAPSRCQTAALRAQ